MSEEQNQSLTPNDNETPTPAATAPVPAPPDSPSPTPPTPVPAVSSDEEQGDQGDSPKAGKQIETLDDALKVISDLRAENARQRTNAKASAADEARSEIAGVLAKALGLPTEAGGDEVETDPATQVQALTSQIEAQTSAARTAALELAIYRTATKAGGNPDLLLDSRSFLETVATLEPDDTEALQTAITKAVESNPNLRATQAVAPNRTDHTPGGSRSATPNTLEAALQAQHGA